MRFAGASTREIATTSRLARGHGMGAEMEQPIGYVFELEDGKARRARSYIDPDRAFEAVGMRR